MPIYVYAIVNAVLALAVVGGVAGLLMWSILTQHRDPACQAVRLPRRRARLALNLPPLPSVEAERAPQEIVLG